MRRFELKGGTSQKFWQIEVLGTSFTVVFGRIGSTGQTSSKSFASTAACEKEASSLIASKVKKGYVEVTAATRAGKPASPPRPKDGHREPSAKSEAKARLSASDLNALVRAIELGLEPKVKAALAKGPDLNVVVALKQRKTTLLIEAARRPSVAIVRALLDGGADPNMALEKSTPLHEVRSAEAAKLLVGAGADPNARDRWKRTPLHASRNDVDIVRVLLEAGAEVDPKDEAGRTPYVQSTNLEVRALLTERGSRGLEATSGRPLKPKKARAKVDEVDVSRGALGVDRAGRVWIGASSGILCIDGRQISRFEFEESFSVDTIAPGPEGRVYFATNWGLVTFTAAGEKWRLYSMQDSSIHDNHLTEMFVDGKGRAYLLGYGAEQTVDRPISVFDPGEGTFTLLTAGSGLPKGLEIKCLAFDDEDQLVFGTTKGVRWSDGKTWAAKGTIGRMGDVRAMAALPDGLWVGLWQGVHRVERTGKSQVFPTSNGVKCMCRDGDALWVGLSYGGLLRIEDGKTTSFKSESSGLPEDDVETLALGGDGTLWIAANGVVATTKGGVVKRFDGEPSVGPAKTNAKTTRAAEIGEAASSPLAKASRKKRKLAPLPKAPFVPLAKLPKFVVDAVRGAKLEGITADAVLAFVRPSIGFEIGRPAAKAGSAVGSSKLGGRPDLREGAEWPSYDDDEDRKLPFLLQVNARDVAKYDLEGLLPNKGLIAFFAETVPDTLESCKIVYDDLSKKPKRLDWPEDLVDRKSEVDFVAQLPEHELSFYPTWTLPSLEYLEAFAELSEGDRSELRALERALRSQDPKESSTTRILGWPDNLQGEIVSSPKEIVLLQLDASMKAPKGVAKVFRHWGEGLVHFVVGQDDLAKGKLGKVEGFLAYT